MLIVQITTRDDPALIRTSAEFNADVLEGELYVDTEGNVYISVYITENLRSPGAPTISLLNLKGGCIFRAEAIAPDVWPLRRLEKSEAVTIRNGE